MTKSQLGLIGSFLAAGALTMVGCGGGSGGGGSGGKADGGGLGGKGGSADAGTGGKGGAGGIVTPVDAGNDIRMDVMPGTGGSMDAGVDRTDSGPCVTSVGAGNQLLFSFDNGSNIGWFAEVQSVGYMFGSTKTDGDRCPGAVSLAINYSSFSNPNDDIAYKYSTPGNWTGFAKLHASVKLVTSTYAAINGVQPFFQTNSFGSYSNGGFTGVSTFTDGRFHEVVFDMLHPNYTSGAVVFSSITQFGVQILLAAATDGGPPAPTDVQMLVDDVWLEPAPPAIDAGMDAAADVPTDVPTDTGTDVPAVDTGVDVAPVDTGTDTLPVDATAD